MQYLFVLAMAISLAGGLYFLVRAFQQSAVQGLLVLFVPFYLIVWARRHGLGRQFWMFSAASLLLYIGAGVFHST